jgi:hypothetical protein
VFETPET